MRTIIDGITFEEYALQTAKSLYPRWFDENYDPPVAYCEERLSETLAVIGHLKSLDDVQKHEYGEKERDSLIAHIQAQIAMLQSCIAKYEQMLMCVESWEPPTPNHIDLKNHMLREIHQLISRCRDTELNFEMKRLESAITSTSIDCYEDALKTAEITLNYFESKINNIRDADKQMREWKADFYKSIEIDLKFIET